MANQGKRMVKENLIAEIGQGGGAEYTAGTGITISDETIAVNTETVAMKTDIPSYTAGTGIDITNNEISVDNTIATKSDVEAVEVPTYGIEWAGAADYDARYPMQYDFQTLIDAGMPILGTTTETETNYPDSYIVIPKGSIFKVKGYFAIKRQTGGYQVFAAADKSSNRLNVYATYDATRVTNRIMNVDNARPGAVLTFTPTAEEQLLGVTDSIVPLTGSANGQTAVSGETADDSYYSLKTAYYKIPVSHPVPSTRYDTQITMPTTDGTYVLKATIADGVTTLEWVADQA